MDCPKCPGILKRIGVPGENPVVIERCPICGGIWFDRDELPGLLSGQVFRDTRIRLELDAEFDEGLLAEINFDQKETECPRCGQGRGLVKLRSKRSVLIDYCARCSGIWLDRGEFDRLSESSLLERKLGELARFLHSRFK